MTRIKQHRASRTAMYLCFVFAGFPVWFLYLPFLADLVNTTVIFLGMALTVGGIIGAIGHIFHILPVERAAYPLLIMSLIVLVCILFFAPGQSAARTFVALLILALAFGLYGRQKDLKTLIDLNKEIRANALVEERTHEN